MRPVIVVDVAAFVMILPDMGLTVPVIKTGFAGKFRVVATRLNTLPLLVYTYILYVLIPPPADEGAAQSIVAPVLIGVIVPTVTAPGIENGVIGDE